MPSRGVTRTTPTLVESNHLHLLVNGAYLPAELELDDERFEMLQKLLSRRLSRGARVWPETIAGTMAKTTGLPPYHYKTENVTPVGAQRIRLRPELDGDAALPMPHRLSRAVRDEQPRGFCACARGRITKGRGK